MRISSKISIVLATVVAAVSVGTVAATWTYSGNEIEPKVDTIDVDLADYKWSGSESLPSGEGSNHAELIQRIIDALNGTLDDNDNYTTLIDNMEDRAGGNIIGWGKQGYYGSMDPQADDNSADDIITDDTKNLSFVVEYDYTENRGTYTFTSITIYTTSVDLGESGTSRSGVLYSNTKVGNPTIPYGEWIYCIYQTTLTNESGSWEAVETTEGKAKMDWYDENRSLTPQATQIPCFDVDSWEAASANTDIGGNIYNAIWTFDTDTPTVYADSADETWYYQLVTTGAITMNYTTSDMFVTNTFSADYAWNKAGKYDVTTSSLNATINIYYGGNDGSSQIDFVKGTRETPDIEVDIVGSTTTKTQTTTDTINYYDSNGDLSYYTVTVYTVVTTTTATDETVEISYTTTTYDSSGSKTAEEPGTDTLTALPNLKLSFDAATASYYYFEVFGNTEIPLTIDLE